MSEARSFSTEMFRRSDAKDVDGWTALMTEDVHFVFGNADPIDGRDAVHAAITAFFESIRAINHDVVDAWIVEDKLIQRLQVTYTRLDGGVLSVPAANILTRRDGLISEYHIYVDNSALYA
jgi:ketosteroid isomerase-like protein